MTEKMDDNVGPAPRAGRKEELPKRKQIHLECFDYSDCDTVFFVTLCSYDKQQYFARKDITKNIIGEIDFRVTRARSNGIYLLRYAGPCPFIAKIKRRIW